MLVTLCSVHDISSRGFMRLYPYPSGFFHLHHKKPCRIWANHLWTTMKQQWNSKELCAEFLGRPVCVLNHKIFRIKNIKHLIPIHQPKLLLRLCVNVKTIFSGIGIITTKIRWSCSCVFFIMEIPVMVRCILYQDGLLITGMTLERISDGSRKKYGRYSNLFSPYSSHHPTPLSLYINIYIRIEVQCLNNTINFQRSLFIFLYKNNESKSTNSSHDTLTTCSDTLLL